MTDEIEPFTDIKLVGGKYRSEGLPVSSVLELERYERLVIEVAKALWREANDDRTRIPRKFSEKLGLRLRAVEPGSVIPVLERSHDGLAVDDIFDQARDKLDEEFAKIVAGQWDNVDLPPRAMQVLKRFGSTLQEGEAFLFRASTPVQVRYDQGARRRFLARHWGATVEIDGHVIGIVKALNADQHTFVVNMPGQASAVPGKFSDESLFDDFRDALTNREDTFLHRLTGKLMVNGASELVSVADVIDVEVFISAEDAGGQRLIDLAGLKEGWDGAGAPSVDLTCLEFTRDLMENLKGADRDLPYIYPTPIGGVQLEWHGAGEHTEIEIFPDDLKMEAYHLGADGESDEVMSGLTEALAFLSRVGR